MKLFLKHRFKRIAVLTAGFYGLCFLQILAARLIAAVPPEFRSCGFITSDFRMQSSKLLVKSMAPLLRTKFSIYTKSYATLHSPNCEWRSRRPHVSMQADPSEVGKLEIEISLLEAHLYKLREQLSRQRRQEPSKVRFTYSPVVYKCDKLMRDVTYGAGRFSPCAQ